MFLVDIVYMYSYRVMAWPENVQFFFLLLHVAFTLLSNNDRGQKIWDRGDSGEDVSSQAPKHTLLIVFVRESIQRKNQGRWRGLIETNEF